MASDPERDTGHGAIHHELYWFVIICVCVCVKARERERESERGRERRGTFLYTVYSIDVCALTWINVHVMYNFHGLDTNAMLLPGRVPGHKDSDVKLLPSSTMKHAIWELCLQAAAASSMWAVAYSTFTDLWRQLLPNIVVMKT